MKVLLIIPAYNEEESILKTIQTIHDFKYSSLDQQIDLDYVVINDGSTDRTKNILLENKINALHLIMNLGIGGAVQTGYQYAAKYGYDIAVQFDGDGQHDIYSLPQLLAPILSNQADFVIGSRFLPDEKAAFQTTFMRRIGIKVLSSLIYVSSRRKIYDVTSGYRAINKKGIEYFAKKYPVSYPEPESTVHLLKNKYRIKEVAVNMMERAGGKSSIRAFTSIKYMIEVGLAIIISSFMKEDK